MQNKTSLCPCNSKRSYQDCCFPVHQSPQKAQTPEMLMRARYCAYVIQDIDFIFNTYHPSLQAALNKEDIMAASQTKWQRLEIIETKAPHLNVSHELEGYVHFKAFYSVGQQNFCMNENSRFIQENQLWYYVDGELEEIELPTDKLAQKVGRNDPCICQSGLKFKKCCG